jgi:hypothetical protein
MSSPSETKLTEALLPEPDTDNFCCSHSRKSCVVYFTQTLAIAVVLLWALFMLSYNPTENRDLYVSLLSTCLGVFLPQPKLESKVEEKQKF